MGRVENSEVVDLHLTIGIITIINGFNTPVKQQRLSHWIKKITYKHMLSIRNPV